MAEAAYIQLEPRKKQRIIWGNNLMFLSTVMFSFALPVAIPTFMEFYGIVKYQALILGIGGIVGSICILIGGKLGGMIGRKKQIVICNVTRSVLDLIMALKPSRLFVFVAVYCLLQVCDGVLGSSHMAVVSDICIGNERSKKIGILGAINGIGMLIGITGGGILVDRLGPFSLFWTFFVLNAVVSLVFAFDYKTKLSDEPEKMDTTGIILMACSVTLITIWCNFGGSAFGQFSGTGIAILAAFILITALFVIDQIKKKDGILPVFLFKSSYFMTSFLFAILLQPMVILCSSGLSIYGQQGLGLSAAVAGTLSLPKNLIFSVLPVSIGLWLAKSRKNFGNVYSLCVWTLCAGFLICAVITRDTPLWVMYAAMVIFGIGTSCQACFLHAYMQLDLRGEQAAIGSAAINFGAGYGKVITNGIYSVCYTLKYADLVTNGNGSLSDVVTFSFKILAFAGLVTVVLMFLVKKKYYIDATTQRELVR